MKKNSKNIVVVGLGYVGLPLAISFAKKANVIGFDYNSKKIELYKKGIDVTNEVGDEELQKTKMKFTDNPSDIKKGEFIIVAVPTPVDSHNKPDLTPVESASTFVGKNLAKGSIVVYESTVYPGVTEEICVPILEKESGLKCGVDFKIGYSPERINPGDKVHRFETITKIVSGMDNETLEKVAETYEMVVSAGVYRASSIRVAEAAKVIENSQRDINIAFVNELSVIFSRMGLDTNEVLDAAGSKWNFLNFRPGLVGGHCIGVDPYYLTYKAEEIGYRPEVILSGRRINDNMGKYIAQNIIKELIKNDIQVKNSKILIKGITFKENVPDIRNSKVIDIIRELQEYSVNVLVEDPYAETEEVFKEYGLKLSKDVKDADAIIFAVAHNQYKSLKVKNIKEELKENRNLIFDIKAIFNRKELESGGLKVWRL